VYARRKQVSDLCRITFGPRPSYTDGHMHLAMRNMTANWNRILLISGALVALLAGQTHLQAAEGRERLRDYLRKEMRELRIPGMQVAVVRHQKIVFLEALGMAEIGNAVPVTDKTVISIASATKAFTGVAVMQLVENGKLELTVQDIAFSYLLQGLGQSVRSGDVAAGSFDPKLAAAFAYWAEGFVDQYSLNPPTLEEFSSRYKSMFGVEFMEDKGLAVRGARLFGVPTSMPSLN
jgi:hypothetical protein